MQRTEVLCGINGLPFEGEEGVTVSLICVTRIMSDTGEFVTYERRMRGHKLSESELKQWQSIQKELGKARIAAQIADAALKDFGRQLWERAGR